VTAEAGGLPGQRAFIDLHCHTSTSFDSLADPRSVVRAAAARGLTHIAITDHDRIDGALRARDAAPAGLTVIVGEEVKTSDGDMICLFLERAVAPGRPALQTIAEVRAQGGLVGIPHPFDRFRSSLSRVEGLEELATQVDYVEAYNARVIGSGNDRAAAFARSQSVPGVAVSDAHTVFEVADSYSVLTGQPGTAEGLRRALAGGVEIVPGRASYVVRLFTPIAKGIQRVRGNGRIRPAGSSSAAALR
jgi:predicted metal-dependent phosphoesterase TrpH